LPSHWSVVFNPTRGSASELYLGQAIFGGQKLQGHLHRPSAEFPLGSGITMEATNLAYSVPEAEDLDREKLEKVDDHIRRAIRRRATPGAQLLVAKNGKIVYQKSYGHHTYKRKSLVQTSNQYDLASVTKAAATSLAIMKLYENGQIDLAAQVRDYLPQFSNRPVGRYTIEQVLTHQTGVQSDLPIGKLLNRKYVSEEESDDFPYQIGPDRWLDKDVPAKVYEELKRVNYTKRRVYRYSDVNYVLLQMVVEAIIEQDMNKFLRAEIYDPLGLQRLGFLPLEQFPEEQMIPTVEDEWMRSSLLRGFPQDEGASLLGGVAGHAGLFGNVTDLAALFQMLLNEGELNGVQIFTPETVQLFTAHSEMNYRALGFDRLVGGWPNVIKNGASKATFGHTGYSGTCVWADPDNDLIFVLLTNRIHPNPYNKRFLKMAVRGRVHRDIYRSIEGA
ncbi:MAG: serine hydrolase, partial [Bacteroidota bacterium]